MSESPCEPRTITLAMLHDILRGSGEPVVDQQELEDWIARRWVQPEEFAGDYLFEEIDVARIRLIRTLRYDLQLDIGALPVVLSLLDQLHAVHRALRDASKADSWLTEL